MGIVQLGKDVIKGTYCRGLQNSHKNLTALRDVQQFGDVLVILYLRFGVFHSADEFLALSLRLGLFVLLPFFYHLFSLFSFFCSNFIHCF